MERLIGEDHAARAIWILVGRLDLNPFYRAVESSEDEAVKKLNPPNFIPTCGAPAEPARARVGVPDRG